MIGQQWWAVQCTDEINGQERRWPCQAVACWEVLEREEHSLQSGPWFPILQWARGNVDEFGKEILPREWEKVKDPHLGDCFISSVNDDLNWVPSHLCSYSEVLPSESQTLILFRNRMLQTQWHKTRSHKCRPFASRSLADIFMKRDKQWVTEEHLGNKDRAGCSASGQKPTTFPLQWERPETVAPEVLGESNHTRMVVRQHMPVVCMVWTVALYYSCWGSSCGNKLTPILKNIVIHFRGKCLKAPFWYYFISEDCLL